MRRSASKPPVSAPAPPPSETATASRCSSASQLSTLPLDYQCPCCWKTLLRPVVTSCGHTFCEACLHRWTVDMDKTSCPCCRASLPQAVPPVDRQLERLIELCCPLEAAGSPDSNSLQAEACSAAEAECLGGQEGIEVEPEPTWDPANISCCWLMHRGSSVRHPFP
ncbi:hypothetical protein D9Q98_004841 [Chlorella vulgaris]|uniref:RING-type domain-containing protein n=1 Tax=Chlorella vulgaris TaxID=3077 RepID=A0A9D4TMZ0_CHLVU|nr:hypothetical protein D9Q98_004841 [Chlorella vulgaris]